MQKRELRITILHWTFSLGVLAATVVYVTASGVERALATLGWGAGLVPVVAVGSVLTLRAGAYYKSAMLFNLLLVGLVVYNHFIEYLILRTALTANILTTWVVMILITPPLTIFAWLLNVPFKKEKDLSEGGINALRNLTFAWCLAMMVSILGFMPFLASVPSMASVTVRSASAILTATAISYVALRLLPDRELDYLLKPADGMHGALKPLHRMKIILLCVFVFSLVLERFRGLWRLSLVCAALSILLVLALFRVYARHLIRAAEPMEVPSSFHIIRFYKGRHPGHVMLVLWALTMVYFIAIAWMKT